MGSGAVLRNRCGEFVYRDLHFKSQREGVVMNTKLSSSVNRILAVVLAICLAGTGMAWGQDVTAAINGQVTDQSGAALKDALVTARDVGRGTARPAHTHSRGGVW